MPPILSYGLLLFLALLLAFLLPLLLQLQRAAVSAERFLDSARLDLNEIQKDVRASRERIESVSATAQGAVDRLVDLGVAFAEMGVSVKGSLEQLTQRMPGAALGSLMGTLGSLWTLFRRRHESTRKEEP